MDQTLYEAAKAALADAAERYYRDGTSPMSDADFDELMGQVAAFEASHPQANPISQSVGAGVVAGTVEHVEPMLSLDNVFSADDLDRWTTGLGLVTVVVEPKLDGLAMAVRYRDGQPVQMVTRGDGRHGEDVTAALPLVANLPTVPGWSGEVRGEVVFSHGQFERANQARIDSGKASFANARNAAAGTVNRAARSGAGTVPAGTLLSFVAYGLVGSGDLNHTSAMSWLDRHGFTVALYLLSGEYRDLTQAKPEVGFDLDGLVFKVDDVTDRDRLGTSSRAPKWAIAYKYPAEQAITVLRDVDWAVGRTGSVTPRAILEPVRVGGTTVTYATLHNPSEIARKKLHIGARVVVRRAGEVVPEILGLAEDQGTGRNVLAIEAPKACPNCGERLLDDQARLRCPSLGDCALENRLSYATSRDALDIDGLSDATIAALVAAGRLTRISDLFGLGAGDIADCPTGRTRRDGTSILVGQTTADKLVARIAQAGQDATFERVLVALGLRGTGRSMSRRLAQHFGSMDSLLAADAATIAQVDKLGPVKAASIVAQLHTADMLADIDMLATHGLAMQVAEVAGPKPLAGQVLVVTGTMKRLGSRSEVTGRLEALGASVASSVSAKTTAVVADNPDGSSSKLTKARTLGVPVLDEDGFIAQFGLDL